MVAQMAYEDVVVYAKDIPQYCNEEFFELLGYWQMTKMWGLPNGSSGWANEPSVLMEALTLIESEDNKIEAEKRKKEEERAKLKSKGSSSGKKGRRR